MSLILLALIAAPDLSQQVLDRARQYAQKTNIAQAAFKVEQKGAPPATGTLLYHRGRAFRFDAKWRGSDYTYVVTRGGLMRELERSQMKYDELETGAPFALLPSGISATPRFAFPFFLLAGDFSKNYDPKTKREVVGDTKVLGRVAQTVRFSMMTQMGMLYHEYTIDKNGMVLQFAQYNGALSQRPNARVFTILSMKPLTSLPVARLNLPIPSGYVPYRLPAATGPLPIGQKFPYAGWMGGNLGKGRRTLYALLGVDCAPSAKSVAALQDLKRSGLNVIELSDARTKAQSQGRLYDPTGKSLNTLSAPGTPTFYLVGADGKVQRLWMGYDPAKRADFVKEVQAALQESATH